VENEFQQCRGNKVEGMGSNETKGIQAGDKEKHMGGYRKFLTNTILVQLIDGGVIELVHTDDFIQCESNAETRSFSADGHRYGDILRNSCSCVDSIAGRCILS
jgi:hypothetical protein